MFHQGLMVSFISILVVFFGMGIIVVFIYLSAEMAIRRTKKRLPVDKIITKKEIEVPADVVTAMAMALYFNKFLGDEEQHQITIQKVTMPFSPWLTRGRNSTVTRTIGIFGRKWR